MYDLRYPTRKAFPLRHSPTEVLGLFRSDRQHHFSIPSIGPSNVAATTPFPNRRIFLSANPCNIKSNAFKGKDQCVRIARTAPGPITDPALDFHSVLIPSQMSTMADEFKPQPGDEPDDVLFNTIYGLRTIELNRPKKLNSLNGSMARKIVPRLQVGQSQSPEQHSNYC